MIIRRIDFLLACKSRYHVLDHLCKKMYEAFCRAGFSCRLLEVNSLLVKHLHEDRPDLTISFSGAPCREFGLLLCNDFKIPHLACLVDPPFHYKKLFSSPYIIMSCDDKVGCDYLESRSFGRSLFMPHAVEAELSFNPENKRIYDVVMLATFIDFEKRLLEWKSKLPPEIYRLLEGAAEATFADETTSFMTALQLVIREAKIKIPQLVFQEFLKELEVYIKGRDRVELVKSIRDTEVHIFGGESRGHNWRDYLGKNHSNIVVHDEVEFPEALEIMKQSKIILTSNIKNKYGAHERIFSGMACGGVVLTNENPYLKQYFEDDRSILFYKNRHKEIINQKIIECLKDEAARSQMAHLGREITMRYHTWDHRVAPLIQNLLPLWQKIRNSSF